MATDEVGTEPGTPGMKFQLDRLLDYSSSTILEEIRRVAVKLGTSPLKKAEFDAISRVSSSTIIRRFGSWETGLKEAGVSHLYGGKLVTKKMRLQNARTMTDAELITELKLVSQAVGRKDLTTSEIDQHSRVGQNIFAKRFGSFRAALEAAGLEVRPQSRRYTDEDCFENMYEVWKHYGRPPRLREMDRWPSSIGREAYLIRFNRSWKQAIKAFLERVNVETGSTEVESSRSVIATGPAQSPQGEQKSRDERRQVPLGLRMKILRRDNFRCVLCGDNPPRNPECVLHVDHILPWSKGGKTEVENLRTLCSVCNLGRSNRHVE